MTHRAKYTWLSRTLREMICKNPIIEPKQRLKNWIERDNLQLPEFQIKEINRDDYRKLMKRFKGSRTHGIDMIDSYSIKIASPLIEDALIHLINLSINYRNTYLQRKQH